MNKKPKAFLFYQYLGGASTIKEHVDAIIASRKIDVIPIQVFGKIYFDLDDVDIIFIHYSICMFNESYLSSSSCEKIKLFKGLKACFIQDEYRFIDKTVNKIKDLGIDILFTCVPESEFEKVYPKLKLPNLRLVNVLTGYVPDFFRDIKSSPSYEERNLDVVFRARPLPFSLGELAQEKDKIAKIFLEKGHMFHMNMNISTREQDRIYGKKWLRFLMNSKACLGTESGASVFDFTGEIDKKIQIYLEKNPKASFEDVQKKFLLDHEKKIKLNQISPRAFEAAACRTMMVLYEGEYSGILKKWKHYIPLLKDHSNLDQVMKAIKDKKTYELITEQAYNDIILNSKYSYVKFTNIVEHTVMEEILKVDQIEQSYLERKRNLINSQTILIHKIITFIKFSYIFVKEFFYKFIFGFILKKLSIEKTKKIKRFLKKIIK